MRTTASECYVYIDSEVPDLWAAEICAGIYGDIKVYALDPIRAQGFAWRELGNRMVRRTETIAYRAMVEGLALSDDDGT